MGSFILGSLLDKHLTNASRLRIQVILKSLKWQEQEIALHCLWRVNANIMSIPRLQTDRVTWQQIRFGKVVAVTVQAKLSSVVATACATCHLKMLAPRWIIDANGWTMVSLSGMDPCRRQEARLGSTRHPILVNSATDRHDLVWKVHWVSSLEVQLHLPAVGYRGDRWNCGHVYGIELHPARLLARAIEVCDELEHRYKNPTVECAEDLVKLLRRTI